ncbi:uncharacterized protein LOC124171393 isoform X2 [Ischnura elegans]|uniref:uncharacterized protein LOC124171393 isoform X2 n=1 Tax=Ischnura elegans TaxID=197161 RepID=UPI001ED86664|nr:uncharacterized protein LOC124171393 isoform X2 [Ischnura elegans]
MVLRVALLLAAGLAVVMCRGPPGWPPPSVVQDAKNLLDALRIRPSRGREVADSPPRHMRELYEGLASGRVAAGGGAVVTVRSTAPLAEPHRKNMVVFNMSSLAPNEEVFTAHLHLRRRRLPREGAARHQRRLRKTLEPPMHVRLVRVDPRGRKRPTNIASYPVARGERGWRVLDVTAAVRESAATANTRQVFLGVRFEERGRSERRRARRPLTLPVEDFLQARCADEPMAYLVLYSKASEDGEEVEEEDADYRDSSWFNSDLEIGSVEDLSVTDNELKVMGGNYIGPTRKGFNYADYLDAGYGFESNKIHEPTGGFGNLDNMGKKHGKDSQFYKKERKQRKGRDISDNELPRDDDGLAGVLTKQVVMPAVANGMVFENVNPTGLPLEEHTTSPYPSLPLAQPGSWRDAGVRRQRDGIWGGAIPGDARPEGKANNGQGSARTTEDQSRSNRKSDEIPLKEGKESAKSSQRSSRFAVGVGKDGSEKASRGKGGEEDREDMWRSFGESTSTRRKGGRYRSSDGPAVAKSPKDVKDGRERQSVLGRDTATGNCSLRSFTVDFRAFGWSDWLYGPRIFQSGSCTGACPHPEPKDFYSTTRGKTLYMMSSLRQRDYIVQIPDEQFANDWSALGENRRGAARVQAQEPCCAPDSLAPLIMLYVDENEDFVLRLFPRLKVISCACQ